jgi:hypothetical protein
VTFQPHLPKYIFPVRMRSTLRLPSARRPARFKQAPAASELINDGIASSEDAEKPKDGVNGPKQIPYGKTPADDQNDPFDEGHEAQMNGAAPAASDIAKTLACPCRGRRV